MIDIEQALWAERRTYVAVSEWGYGIDKIAADAIMKAQMHVPVDAEPTQMLIYARVVVWEDELEPVGVKFPPVWQEGVEPPKLVGLTNTHQIFVKRPR